MAAIFFPVTIATAGTPQQLATAPTANLPTISMGGITYPSGSATQRGMQIVVQSNPGNTGNVFVGGRALNKGTLANVGAILTPGQSIIFGQYGGATTLDDIWVDAATSGSSVLVSLLG